MPEQQRENRDYRSDVLTKFLTGTRNIDALHGKSFKDTFQDQEHSKAFLNQLEEKQFVDLLNGINGILRDKRSKDWGMDGKSVMLTGFAETDYPPHENDKTALLTSMYEAMGRMIKADREIEDLATLLSVSLTSIHPYADGNGRTSRFIYDLLVSGTNDGWEDRIKELLSEDGSFDLDTSPTRVNPYLRDLVLQEEGVTNQSVNGKPLSNLWSDLPISKLPLQDTISPESKHNFQDIYRHDDQFAFAAVSRFLIDNGHQFEYTKEFDNLVNIDLDQLLPTLNQNDIDQILGNYWKMKARRVELLIDCIENPTTTAYNTDRKGNTSSFLSRLKQHTQ
ncbi:MAG: Fic family protein [Parcubacteria group bacterium]|nr:Fic family protein [Parcubacteria group bacterium]